MDVNSDSDTERSMCGGEGERIEGREGGKGRRLVKEKDSVLALLNSQSQPSIT